ncbi:unnamed protein product, partial [Meganyctiphanes norvegica]
MYAELEIGLATIWALLDPCIAYPIDQNVLSVGVGGSYEQQWSSTVVGAVVALATLLCLTTTLIACVCCKRQQRGFKELNSVSSRVDAGLGIGGSSDGLAEEFTMFPPAGITNLSQSTSQIAFEPLPDIRPRSGRLAQQQITNKTLPASFPQVRSQDLLPTDEWFAAPHQSFPRNQLQYVKEIGKGWFGHVLEGRATGIFSDHSTSDASSTGQVPDTSSHKQQIPVAVKVLREDATQTEQMYFLHELRPYRDLNHPNVLRVLAHCLETEPFLILMQLCKKGDLKAVVRNEKSITEATLLRMCLDVASGLKHMHDHNFIHTDLAARNCVVDENMTVKIGDYGYNIDFYKNEYYCAGEVALPLRWCAPETLKCTDTTIETKEVTRAANVWSFGVIVWEIISRGELPYRELDDDGIIQQVIVDRATTLKRPVTFDLYAEKLYSVMSQCWKMTTMRPGMSHLYSLLAHLCANIPVVQQQQQQDSNQLNDSQADFESRWQHLQQHAPQDHSIVNISNTSDLRFESDFSLSVSGPIDHTLSGSLQNLRGSIEDLDAKMAAKFGSAIPSWLGMEPGQPMDSLTMEITDAIQRLDEALAGEKSEPSTTQTSPEKEGEVAQINFKVGKDSFVSNPPESKILVASGGEPGSLNGTDEEEGFTMRLEKGEFTEMVRIKSQSVQDFMKLTVVDDGGSDSDGTSQRNSLLFEPLNSQESAKVSSSEGNIKEAIRDKNFMTEIEKLQAQRKFSIISEASRENPSSIEYRNYDFSLGLTPEHNSEVINRLHGVTDEAHVIDEESTVITKADNIDINIGSEIFVDNSSSGVEKVRGSENKIENRTLVNISEQNCFESEKNSIVSNALTISKVELEKQNNSDFINEAQVVPSEAQFSRNNEILKTVIKSKSDSINYNQRLVTDNVLSDDSLSEKDCDNEIQCIDKENQEESDLKKSKVTKVLDSPDCIVSSRESKPESIPDILVQNSTIQSMYSSPDSPINIHNGYQPKEFRFVMNTSTEDLTQNDSVSFSKNIADKILFENQNIDFTRSNKYSSSSNSSNEVAENNFLNHVGKARQRITSTPIKSGDFSDINELDIEQDDDSSSCFSDEVSAHDSSYDGDGDASSHVIAKDTDSISGKQRLVFGFQRQTSDGEDDKEDEAEEDAEEGNKEGKHKLAEEELNGASYRPEELIKGEDVLIGALEDYSLGLFKSVQSSTTKSADDITNKGEGELVLEDGQVSGIEIDLDQWDQFLGDALKMDNAAAVDMESVFPNTSDNSMNDKKNTTTDILGSTFDCSEKDSVYGSENVNESIENKEKVISKISSVQNTERSNNFTSSFETASEKEEAVTPVHHSWSAIFENNTCDEICEILGSDTNKTQEFGSPQPEFNNDMFFSCDTEASPNPPMPDVTNNRISKIDDKDLFLEINKNLNDNSLELASNNDSKVDNSDDEWVKIESKSVLETSVCEESSKDTSKDISRDFISDSSVLDESLSDSFTYKKIGSVDTTHEIMGETFSMDKTEDSPGKILNDIMMINSEKNVDVEDDLSPTAYQGIIKKDWPSKDDWSSQESQDSAVGTEVSENGEFWQQQMMAWQQAAHQTRELLQQAASGALQGVKEDDDGSPCSEISKSPKSPKSPYSSNDMLNLDDEGTYVSYNTTDDEEVLGYKPEDINALRAELSLKLGGIQDEKDNKQLQDAEEEALNIERENVIINYRSSVGMALSPIKEESFIDDFDSPLVRQHRGSIDANDISTHNSSIEFQEPFNDSSKFSDTNQLNGTFVINEAVNKSIVDDEKESTKEQTASEIVDEALEFLDNYSDDETTMDDASTMWDEELISKKSQPSMEIESKVDDSLILEDLEDEGPSSIQFYNSDFTNENLDREEVEDLLVVDTTTNHAQLVEGPKPKIQLAFITDHIEEQETTEVEDFDYDQTDDVAPESIPFEVNNISSRADEMRSREQFIENNPSWSSGQQHQGQTQSDEVDEESKPVMFNNIESGFSTLVNEDEGCDSPAGIQVPQYHPYFTSALSSISHPAVGVASSLDDAHLNAAPHSLTSQLSLTSQYLTQEEEHISLPYDVNYVKPNESKVDLGETDEEDEEEKKQSRDNSLSKEDFDRKGADTQQNTALMEHEDESKMEKKSEITESNMEIEDLNNKVKTEESDPPIMLRSLGRFYSDDSDKEDESMCRLAREATREAIREATLLSDSDSDGEDMSKVPRPKTPEPTNANLMTSAQFLASATYQIKEDEDEEIPEVLSDYEGESDGSERGGGGRAVSGHSAGSEDPRDPRYTPDWETDSDSDGESSSTSGEFCWREGEEPESKVDDDKDYEKQ